MKQPFFATPAVFSQTEPHELPTFGVLLQAIACASQYCSSTILGA
jgi:hypothetical protein